MKKQQVGVGVCYSNLGIPYWVGNDGASCPIEELNSSHLANIFLLLGESAPKEIRDELKKRMELAKKKLKLQER